MSVLTRLRAAIAAFINPQPLCEYTRGEWRCRCPASTTFDTSINLPGMRACAKCGAERPS